MLKSKKEVTKKQNSDNENNKLIGKVIYNIFITIFFLLAVFILSYFFATNKYNYSKIVSKSLVDDNKTIAVHSTEDLKSHELSKTLKDYKIFNEYSLPYDNNRINNNVFSSYMYDLKKLSTLNKIIFDIHQLEDNNRSFLKYQKEQEVNINAIDNKIAKDFGFNILKGRFPVADSEIMVTKFVYEAFKEAGYKENNELKNITKEEDLIGKKITINVSNNRNEENKQHFTIVGILDTKLNLDLYKNKFKNKENIRFDTIEYFRKSYIKNLSLNSLTFSSNFLKNNKEIFEYSSTHIYTPKRNEVGENKKIVDLVKTYKNNSNNNLKAFYAYDPIFSLMKTGVSNEEETVRTIFIAALIFIVSIFIMSILSLKYDSKNYFRFNGFFKKIFIRNTILLLCGSLFGFLGTYITTLLINNNFSSVLFIKNLLSVSFVSYILSFLASLIVTFLLFLSTLFIMYRKKKIKY